MKLKWAVSFGIVLLFLYFLYRFNTLKRLLELTAGVNPAWLFASAVPYALSYTVRAKRFSVAFPEIPGLQLVAVVAVHTFLNNILPLRSGELSLPILLRRFSGVRMHASSTVLLLLRLLDLLSVAFLFSACALALRTGTSVGLFTALLAGCLALLAVTARVLSSKKGTLGEVATVAKNMLSPLNFLLLFCLSLAVWLLKFTSFYLIMTAGGVNLSFLETVFVSTFGEITTVLPVHSFGGFGTYEAGLTGGFAILGKDVESALAVALYFHITLLAMSAVVATAGWLYLTFKKT